MNTHDSLLPNPETNTNHPIIHNPGAPPHIAPNNRVEHTRNSTPTRPRNPQKTLHRTRPHTLREPLLPQQRTRRRRHHPTPEAETKTTAENHAMVDRNYRHHPGHTHHSADLHPVGMNTRKRHARTACALPWFPGLVGGLEKFFGQKPTNYCQSDNKCVSIYL